MRVFGSGPTTDGRQPIKQDITYFKPVFRDDHLGGTPYDYVDQNPKPVNPYVTCSNNVCGALPNEVHRKLPVMNADGTPSMVAVKVHLEDTPQSPGQMLTIWGGIAGAVAGTAGILGGAIIGQPVLGGGIGAVLAGGVAGGIGAWKARGDRIKLQWTEYGIRNESYVGYKETVAPTTVQSRTAYRHHFEPVLESHQVGTYKVPSIIHYRDNK